MCSPRRNMGPYKVAMLAAAFLLIILSAFGVEVVRNAGSAGGAPADEVVTADVAQPTNLSRWPGVARLTGSPDIGVPWGDARHYSRSTSGQTPVIVKSPHDQFYGGLIANSVGDWTQSFDHAVSYYGYANSDAACYDGLYQNCITVAHDSGRACGTGAIYHDLIPSFGHVHISHTLIAVNLSSACVDLWHSQNNMCRWIGKALGVTGVAGTSAPCDGSLHPHSGDISVLNYLGAHYHAGSIHLPPGV